MDIYTKEKDAIAFLGLLSIASKNFDAPYQHADNTVTHTKGLNIYAVILDNYDGDILGQGRNTIHTHCNPLLHAEQAALQNAIATVNLKRPRDPQAVSVESCYRSHLFNDSGQIGNPNFGGTIYTTLEPCPYCTSALLVSRMKRIVYILPDLKFGSAYPYLKDKYYPSYNMGYGPADFEGFEEKSSLFGYADSALRKLRDYVSSNPNQFGTLVLDHYKTLLDRTCEFFLSLDGDSLITSGEEKNRNLKTLNDFKTILTV
jgi:tRNA(Arg) A34 adenosine deaminase TadA